MALIALAGSTLGGCEGPSAAEVDSTQQAVINGTVDQYSSMAAFLGISKSTGLSKCSGTVVADRWVLTAKHCLTDGANQVSPTAVYAKLSQGITANSDNVVRHPSLDVGLVHFSSSLLRSYEHATQLYPGWAADNVMKPVRCSGWGNNTFTGDDGTLRYANLVISQMSDNQTTYRVARNQYGQMLWKGDSGGSCEQDYSVLGVQSTSHYVGTTVDYSTQVAIETFRGWAISTMKTWNGCWDGTSVCAEQVNSTYLARHPQCKSFSYCGGTTYSCGDTCPPPASDELGSALVNGSSDGWTGCRGNGGSACTDLVNSNYFVNHPACSKNPNCAGSYYPCNSIACPTPTAYERADSMGVTTNSIPRPAQSQLLLKSNNGQYKVWWQSDGNLVEYRTSDGRALWSSGTAGRGATLVYQFDGNIVIYNAAGGAVWNTGTSGTAFGSYLKVQDDSNLVIYSRSGGVLWHR